MNRKNVVYPLVVLGVSAVAVVGVAETAVRCCLADPMDFTVEMWRYARGHKRVAADPRVGHEHIPNTRGRLMGVDVQINSHGLRDREIRLEKTPGTRRILMLGDSVTFGWGVPQDQTVSKQLENLLNAAGHGPVDVINAGVGNYNTQMEVQYFFNQGYKYEPDLVVLNYFINDAEETPSYSGNILNENLLSFVYFAGRVDLLLRMVGDKQDWRGYYRDLYKEDAPGWRMARAALLRLGEHCQANAHPCLVADYPELHELKKYPFKSVQEKVKASAEQAGLEYVNLLPAVAQESPRELWVTVPDPHPNAKAHRLFARHLYKSVHRALSRLDQSNVAGAGVMPSVGGSSRLAQ